MEQHDNVNATVDADGPLSEAGAGWHWLLLGFSESVVVAQVNGAMVAQAVVMSVWNSVVRLGSGHHRAYYAHLRLMQFGNDALTSDSFILDIALIGCACRGCSE